MSNFAIEVINEEIETNKELIETYKDDIVILKNGIENSNENINDSLLGLKIAEKLLYKHESILTELEYIKMLIIKEGE